MKDEKRFCVHLLGLCCFGLSLVGLSTPAHAQSNQWSGSQSYSPAAPAPRRGIENIGEQGQIVLGIERVTGLFWDHGSIDFDNNNATTTDSTSTFNFSLFGSNSGCAHVLPDVSEACIAESPSSLPRLAFDYFIMDGISLGGSLGYTYHGLDTENRVETPSIDTETTQDLGSESLLILNPRAGYALPFDDTFGVWARAGLLYNLSSRSIPEGDTEVTLSVHHFGLSLDAQFILSPFKHFALLAGPFLDLTPFGGFTLEQPGTTDERNASLTSYGLTAGMVGYFGG